MSKWRILCFNENIAECKPVPLLITRKLATLKERGWAGKGVRRVGKCEIAIEKSAVKECR